MFSMLSPDGSCSRYLEGVGLAVGAPDPVGVVDGVAMGELDGVGPERVGFGRPGREGAGLDDGFPPVRRDGAGPTMVECLGRGERVGVGPGERDGAGDGVGAGRVAGGCGTKGWTAE